MKHEWSLTPLRPRLALVFVGVASSLWMAGCAARLATTVPSSVDLSGHWALNAALSDDPEALMEEQRERMRERAGRAGPMSGGPMRGDGTMGGGRPPRGDFPGGSGPSENRPGGMGGGRMPEMMPLPSAAQQMNIRQSAKDLLIESEDSSTHYVYGQKSVVSVPGGAADRQAGWQDKAFVITTKSPDGPRTVQRYALSPEGQLIVTTQVSGRGPSLKVKQVYERSPEDHS